jgi:hypothetical protein
MVLILTLKYIESAFHELNKKETGLIPFTPGKTPGRESCFIPLIALLNGRMFVVEALKPKPFNHYLIRYVLPLKTF